MKPVHVHLAIAGAFVAFAVAAHVFWFMRIESLTVEAEQLSATRAETERAALRIEDAKNALGTLAESEARILDYFVPESDVVPFLEEIGATGDSLGSAVEVVGVSADAGEGGRGHMTLSLRITGGFGSVMRTIGALEFGPFDSKLISVSLDGGEERWTASAVYSIGTRK